MDTGGPPRTEWISIGDLLLPVLRNWRVTVVCFAIGVGLALVATALIPSRWEARRTLLVSGAPGDAMVGGIVATGPATRAMSIVSSDVIRESVKNKYGLSDAELDRILSFRLNDPTNSIEIAAERTDRKGAAEMVDYVVGQIEALAARLSKDQSQAALSSLLDVRRAQIEAMAGAADGVFAGLKEPGAGVAVDLSASGDLLQEIITTDAELVSARDQLQAAQDLEVQANLSSDSPNALVQNLQAELLAARLEVDRLAHIQGPQNPQLINARQRVQDLTTTIESERAKAQESTRDRTSPALRPLAQRVSALEAKRGSLRRALDRLSGEGASTWMARAMMEAEGEALKATRAAEQGQLIQVAARLSRFVSVGPAIVVDEPVNKTLQKQIRNALTGGLVAAFLSLLAMKQRGRRKA